MLGKSQSSLSSGLPVLVEVVFDPVEADVLVEEILVLSDLDVLLFAFLLLFIALAHAEEHFLQVGVHLLVEPEVDAIKRGQIPETSIHELQPFLHRYCLGRQVGTSHAEEPQHLGTCGCLVKQLPQ